MCNWGLLRRQALVLSVLLSLLACGAESNSKGGVQADQVADQTTGESQEVVCIDPDKVDPSRMCTMDYTPVCGCDGKTYSNSCVAASAGLLTWVAGACSDAE